MTSKKKPINPNWMDTTHAGEVAKQVDAMGNGVPLDGHVAASQGFLAEANPWLDQDKVARSDRALRWKHEHARWCAETWEAHINAPRPEPKPYLAPTSDATPAYMQSNEMEFLVLRLLDKHFAVIQEKFGGLAGETSDYQTNGYKRDSVEQQTEKIRQFKERERELNQAARWLALGKSSIETGFMQVRRSNHGVAKD